VSNFVYFVILLLWTLL